MVSQALIPLFFSWTSGDAVIENLHRQYTKAEDKSMGKQNRLLIIEVSYDFFFLK